MHGLAFGYAPTYLQHAVGPLSTYNFQADRICTQQTPDSTISHVSHRCRVPERFQSLDHKLGTDFLHHSETLFVWPLLRNILKHYFLKRLMNSSFIFSLYAFYILLFSVAVHFVVRGTVFHCLIENLHFLKLFYFVTLSLFQH